MKHTSFILFFCWLLPFSSWADTVTICPAQQNNKLVAIEVFHGSPQDMFSLAPEPKDQNNGTWADLTDIYTDGEKVTVGCSYQNGLLLNVEINPAITSCKSSNIGGLNISCQMNSPNKSSAN